MKTELIPTTNNVILRAIERKRESDGGIILPDCAQYLNEVEIGEVIETNSGSAFTTFSKGNFVIFRTFDAVKVELKGEEFLIINKDKILAVVNS